MQRALITRDFSRELRARQRLAAARRRSSTWRRCGRRSRGRSCCGRSSSPASRSTSPVRFRSRLSDPLVGRALLVMFVVCLFFFLLDARAGQPVHARRLCRPGYDGPGPNPLLQEHILMAFHPPMLYLGFVGLHGAVRVRHRGPGHRSARRGLADRDPAGDPARLGLPHRRDHPRRLVELRGARVGRLLGVGPGGERVVAARGSPAPPTSTR